MAEACTEVSELVSEDIVLCFASSPNLLREISAIGQAVPAADPQIARRILTSIFAEIRLRGGPQHLDQLERAMDAWPHDVSVASWAMQELVKLRVRAGTPAPALRARIRSVLDGTYLRRSGDESEFGAFLHWIRYGLAADFEEEIAASTDGATGNWETYAAMVREAHEGPDPEATDERLDALLRAAVVDGDHVLVSRVMNLRGQNAWRHGRTAQAEHWFRRVLVECDATGDPTRAVAMHMNLVALLIHARRVQDAEKELHLWAARVAAENVRGARRDVVREALQLARVSGDKRWLVSFVQQSGWTTYEDMCGWIVDGAQAAIRSWVACLVVEAASSLGLPDVDRLFTAAIEAEGPRSDNDEIHLLLACARLYPERARWADLPRFMAKASPNIAAQALASLSRAAVIERDGEARDMIGTCKRIARDRNHPVLRLVLTEVELATNGDWQGCADLADTLSAAGLPYDAALVRCVAFVLAAERAHGVQADRLFEQSHEALAALGLENEVARMRRARSRVHSTAAARKVDRSAPWQAFASTGASDVMISRTLARGQRFPSGYFGMLVEGAAIAESGGEDSLPDIFGAGELFHVRSCIGLPELSVLTSLTTCELSLVPVSAIAAELRSSPALAGELLRWSVERADQNLHRALCGVRDPLRQRVARALRLLIDRVGIQLGEDDWRIPITGVTLAKFVGAKRESTSRVTAQFGREGLLEFVDRSIVVRGREKLVSIEALPQ